MDNKKTVHPEWKAEMARRNEKVDDVSKVLGYCRKSTYNFLSGKSTLKAPDVAILCRHYETTPDRLFPEIFGRKDENLGDVSKHSNNSESA